MDIWAKTDQVDLNSCCITLVGNDRDVHVQGHAVLRNGELGSFMVKFDHNVEWGEDQVSSFDWLRDALVSFIETI